MVVMKKIHHPLDRISVNVSMRPHWYEIEKDGLKKIKLEINHPDQEE